MMDVWYASQYLCTLLDAALDLKEASKMFNTFLQVRLKITMSSETSAFIG